MTATRVSRTKRSSDCAFGALEFEFKEDGRNSRVSDWLRKICFCDGFVFLICFVWWLLSAWNSSNCHFNFLSLYNLYFCSACLCIGHSRDSVKYYSHLRFFVYIYIYIYIYKKWQINSRFGLAYLLLFSFVPHNLCGTHQIELPNAQILSWFVTSYISL